MTDKGLQLIMDFEGLPKKNPLDAYWDSYGKVWTIGYGATHYADGTPVKKGDKLKSKQEAIELLRNMVRSYEKSVDKLLSVELNPYQHDALTSFAYNCGVGNLSKSTLLKKVNKNPNDVTIKNEFAKWNRSGGKILSGLTRRRKAESELYFTPYIKKTTEEKVIETPVEVKEKPVVVKEEKPVKKNILGWFSRFK